MLKIMLLNKHFLSWLRIRWRQVLSKSEAMKKSLSTDSEFANYIMSKIHRKNMAWDVLWFREISDEIERLVSLQCFLLLLYPNSKFWKAHFLHGQHHFTDEAQFTEQRECFSILSCSKIIYWPVWIRNRFSKLIRSKLRSHDSHIAWHKLDKIEKKIWVTSVNCCHSFAATLTWWHHEMETFSALLALCAGNSPVTLTKASDAVLLWSGLNKRLGKQSGRRWFEMPSRSLWRHCNGNGHGGCSGVVAFW